MNGAAIVIGASTLPCEPTLLLLAAPIRRLLSAAVGFSRRQQSSTYLLHTTRDFVVAVSSSVTFRPLVSVCVHTRGGGGIRLAEAPEKGEGNARKIILSTRRLDRNYRSVYCPEGRKLNTPLCVGLQCRVAPDGAHTRWHARKSASHTERKV